MPFYERQPYIQPLPSILAEVMRGEIRVPQFQRPGTEVTWTSDQRGDLLDSVYRGFPIGTVLLWSTKQDIRTMERIGGFGVPTPIPGRPLRLVLDGHQRLSTLVSILGPGLDDESLSAKLTAEDDNERERWFFDLISTI